jgi:hypothetical protein
MRKLGDLFKIKGRFFLKEMFKPEEGQTELNLLLRLLLDKKSIEQSLVLKEELDARYKEIMDGEFETRTHEVQLISNHLK